MGTWSHFVGFGCFDRSLFSRCLIIREEIHRIERGLVEREG